MEPSLFIAITSGIAAIKNLSDLVINTKSLLSKDEKNIIDEIDIDKKPKKVLIKTYALLNLGRTSAKRISQKIFVSYSIVLLIIISIINISFNSYSQSNYMYIFLGVVSYFVITTFFSSPINPNKPLTISSNLKLTKKTKSVLFSLSTPFRYVVETLSLSSQERSFFDNFNNLMVLKNSIESYLIDEMIHENKNEFKNEFKRQLKEFIAADIIKMIESSPEDNLNSLNYQKSKIASILKKRGFDLSELKNADAFLNTNFHSIYHNDNSRIAIIRVLDKQF